MQPEPSLQIDAMILFLDFDGVLHPTWPCPADTAFREVPRLLSVIDDHPEVELVVSSSWRLLRDAPEWDAVPKALRARIVGHTPQLQRRVYREYPVGYQPEPLRYLEILRYLRNRKQPDRPWVALDDDARLFPADCPHLVLCRNEFGDEEECALRTRLQRSGRCWPPSV